MIAAARFAGVRRRVPAWGFTTGVVLVLLATTRFRTRDPAASLRGEIDGQVIAELVIFGIVGLAVITAWVLVSLDGRRPRWPAWILVPYVGLATLSVLWSAAPALTLVRGVELVVLLFFAAEAVRVLNVAGCMRALALAVTAYVLVSALLAAAFPWAAGRWMQSAAVPRFSWFAVHPITCATYAGMGALLLMGGAVRVGGGALRQVRLTLLWAAGAALITVLVLTRSRGPLVAFAAAVVIMAALRFAPRRVLPWLAVSVFASVGLFVVVQWSMAGMTSVGLADSELVRFFLRGQTVEQVRAFSGRAELWMSAEALVSTRPILGYGYQASRGVLLAIAPWAGEAHNALLQTLLDLGAVGVILLAVPVGAALATAARRSADRLPLRSVVLPTMVFVLLTGVTSASFTDAPRLEALVLFVCVAATRARGPAELESRRSSRLALHLRGRRLRRIIPAGVR